MSRLLSFCAMSVALGLAAVAHADSILASGTNAVGVQQAIGTQLTDLNVKGFGLPAGGVKAYVVAPYYSYGTIAGMQWVSPTYSPTDHFAVQVAPNQDYTFTQSFSTLGSFHINGRLLSDNNLVAAYLDSPGTPLASVPMFPDPRADQDLYASYTSPLDFGPTVGAAGADHTLVFVVHNQHFNTVYNPVALDFKALLIQPAVGCGVAQGELWPPNHKLVDVGLEATIAGGSGQSGTAVMVLSNEADQPSGSSGDDHFSPDAADLGVGTLRLRAERLGTGNGRVYLIITKATDADGNTGFCAESVVVPHDQSAASIAAVNAAAASAVAQFEGAGTYPAGYVVVGGPGAPISGPKQ